MMITGHKTRSVFDRCKSSARDLWAPGESPEAYFPAQNKGQGNDRCRKKAFRQLLGTGRQNNA
jgi:hypothetical protein